MLYAVELSEPLGTLADFGIAKRLNLTIVFHVCVGPFSTELEVRSRGLAAADRRGLSSLGSVRRCQGFRHLSGDALSVNRTRSTSGRLPGASSLALSIAAD